MKNMDIAFPCKNDLSFSRVIRARERERERESDEKGEKRLGLILGLILNGYAMS